MFPGPIPAGFGFGQLVDTGATVPFPAEEPKAGSPAEGVPQAGFGRFLDLLTEGANAGAAVVNAVKGNTPAKPATAAAAPRTGIDKTLLIVGAVVLVVVGFVFLRKK